MKNIPNILTVSRIFLVIVFVIMATLADDSYFNNSHSQMYLMRWCCHSLPMPSLVSSVA